MNDDPGEALVERLRPQRRRRRGGFAALIPLILGALAALAATPAAPRTARPDQAAAAGVSHAIRTADPMDTRGRSVAAGVGSLRMAGRRPSPDLPGRAVVHLPRSSPLVVRRVAAGATAVFLGDSYTTGWNGAGIGSQGWPERVARARAWRAINLAVAGTGFMNPGWTNQPLGSRIATAIRLKPDIVVVAAGHNDSRWSTSTTALAADKAIDRLRHALPDALIVVVAPIWPSGHPPARCVALRDDLRREARSVDAVFIDPLAEAWFAGANRRLIGADGIHPTNAGHRRIAERVLADLAGSGLG
jgi:lysophospholipase L1-like esterase